MNMKDCYEILGVRRGATASEIKRAYRQKAKLLHPDMTRGESDAFRELASAYQTLIGMKSRELFEEPFSFKNFYNRAKQKSTFDYRAWLKERTDDESRAKLIIFELMHGNETEAVAEFKRMNMTRTNFRLSRWFTREDFMDYGFILAEELVLRQEYYDAVIILEQIILMEYSYEYFKVFFPEVVSFARQILYNNIEGFISDELALDCFERGINMQLGKKDDAVFLRKMSVCYKRLGDTQTAKACEEEAFRIEKEI
ncbi:MAG: J domain-containing protein [Treponema sp.]|nr:J domain-containing protein [Treponema sp.]